ncbi:MAG: hypothetical protein MUF00_14505 [Gemmatimonadaceae bacterium]|jgi:hypothetical protein|nr:hypothetical protein [Gemmatimonadaceae bacterium]
MIARTRRSVWLAVTLCAAVTAIGVVLPRGDREGTDDRARRALLASGAQVSDRGQALDARAERMRFAIVAIAALLVVAVSLPRAAR